MPRAASFFIEQLPKLKEVAKAIRKKINAGEIPKEELDKVAKYSLDDNTATWSSLTKRQKDYTLDPRTLRFNPDGTFKPFATPAKKFSKIRYDGDTSASKTYTQQVDLATQQAHPGKSFLELTKNQQKKVRDNHMKDGMFKPSQTLSKPALEKEQVKLRDKFLDYQKYKKDLL